MSNDPSPIQADARPAGRRKLLPVAIGAIALAGAGLTYAIAGPGTATQSAAPEMAKVGALAPDFELPSTGGGSWRLSGHRGREVLLVFFRTHT